MVALGVGHHFLLIRAFSFYKDFFMKFFVQMLVIFAIVTAGISPACAFVNGGKGVIQICDSEGIVKNIEVPEEYLPFLPDEKQTKEHENAVKDCSFCMFSAASKTFKTQSFPITVSLRSGYLVTGSGSLISQSLEYKPFLARGPPAIS